MAAPPAGLNPAFRFPWATLLVAAGAVAWVVWPGVLPHLAYDRTTLVQGELWRVWTGHWAHFGWSHLGWNLAVWLPVGVWVEQVAPRRARWYLLWAPPLITAVLLTLVPGLAHYAGLSGVATGWLLLLTLDRLETGRSRAIWLPVLGLVAIKIGFESWRGSSVFADLPDRILPVPQAHVAGAVLALAAHLVCRKKRLR